jgi:GntR family transcriptional repressor for pyruvate dehydrogenase complex
MSQLLANSPPELFGLLTRDATLAERVTEQMKQLIVSGQLRAGDRMPPERELARQFGVSRTVVREAVRSLMAQGLVEVHAGSGSVVRNPSAGAVAESMALFLQVGRQGFDHGKILEVRHLLEVEIAGLAAERRTGDDLVALAAVLQETAHVGGNCDDWLKNDMAFHALLAQATRNELFSLLLDSIADIMISVRRLSFDVAGAPDRTLKYHGAILEQVEKGDPVGARAAMREHLAEAEATMRAALESASASAQVSTHVDRE